MNNCFNISSGDLLLNLEFFVHDRFGSTVDLIYDESRPTSFGSSYIAGAETAVIMIGCRNLDMTSQESVVNLVRTLFHEARHVSQRVTNFECCNIYASECRADDIACRGSAYYYGIVPFHKGMPFLNNKQSEIIYPHYYQNINELDAEYSGIFDTYEFFSNDDLFPTIGDPEQLILNVLNSENRR